MPVLRIEIPPNPDEARIYDEILMRLMQPFRTKDPISVKARQVRTILQIVGTRMLIFDEFQAVLSTRNDRRRLVLEVVKHLGNTLQIPIVAIGTSESSVDAHLAPGLRIQTVDGCLPSDTSIAREVSIAGQAGRGAYSGAQRRSAG